MKDKMNTELNEQTIICYDQALLDDLRDDDLFLEADMNMDSMELHDELS